MPTVRVKGVKNAMQFPYDMGIDDIRSFLQRKFAKQAVTGNQSVNLDPRQPTIQASNPSLATRAAQGIGNALTSSGLISDNSSAQEIGKNVTSIGEFLPGIGDATAGDEFGRALKQGDGVGMALGALGAIPLVGDAVKKLSKIVDIEKLKYDESMAPLMAEFERASSPRKEEIKIAASKLRKRLDDANSNLEIEKIRSQPKAKATSEDVKPNKTASTSNPISVDGAANKGAKYINTKGDDVADIGEIDFDNPITHGSADVDFNGVINSRNYNQPFDGIFASYGETSNYGGNKEVTYYPRKGGIARHGSIDLDENKSIEFLKKRYPDADDDRIDDLYAITAKEANVWDRETNPLKDYGYDDLGEASWESQNVRGLMAVDQGYDAVEMDDEFGTSIMIPLGSKAVKSTKQGN
jgi:hypothetical protein